MYSDIFGLPLPNNRLIADAYAASGEWLVYVRSMDRILLEGHDKKNIMSISDIKSFYTY